MFAPLRTGLAKLGLASIATALCAGCAASVVSYEVERYGTVTGTQVHLGCHDTYEIFDRPDAASFLVTTNAVNESIAGMCGDGAAALPREERMRRVAHLFLEETTDRPDCRIVQERPLTSFQTEFSYRCPAPPPAPKPATPAPRAARR
jgi:hypothetical protein